MAKKNTRSANKGRTKQKGKTVASPQGTRQAAVVICVIFMALGVLSGYIMWAAGNVKNDTLLKLTDVLKGVVGMLSYVLPVILCIMGVIILFVGRGRIKAQRALLVGVGVLVFCGVWHVFSASAIEQTMMVNSYREFIRASYREGATTCVGAGALGALTSWHLFMYLGQWGAAIVLMAVLVVIAIGLGHISMRDVGSRISDRVADGMDEYRQRREVRGREKAELRAQALERRVAREELERERRQEHDRLLEEDRIRREEARNRAEELSRSRRESNRTVRRPQDDDEYESGISTDIIGKYASQPATEGKSAPAAEADERPEAQAVSEEDLENLKSHSRGDQQVYIDEMKRRNAQEGVPMFLDKRVPGKVLTKTGVVTAQETPKSADSRPQLVFEGYDEPGMISSSDDASYAPHGYTVSPVPEIKRSVLELSNDMLPLEVPEVKESANAARTPASIEDVIRPLRTSRKVGQNDYTPRGSSSVRRIDESRIRAENSRVTQPAPQPEEPCAAKEVENYDTNYDAVYNDETEQINDVTQPDTRPASFMPAPESAYAVGTEYEDGMPFERYSEPASVKTDSPMQQYDDELIDYEDSDASISKPYSAHIADAPQPQTAVSGIDWAQPNAASADAQDSVLPDYSEPEDDKPANADDSAFKPLNDEQIAPVPDDTAIAQPIAAEIQDEHISFDGYTNGGSANEKAAQQPTPEVTSKTAPRVAMYTPVNADLERGVGSGTRPDGTPIRMPKAMEEIPQDKPYFYPPVDLLQFSQTGGISLKELQQSDAEKALKLEQTLQSFGIQAKVVGVSRGPAVTRFEMTPAAGVRVSKISGLADDIALNLAATSVRIEAPIPGKSAVGIELPNEKREMVTLRDVLDSPEARKAQSKLAVALGKDNAGKLVIADIAKMPHVLIAGATGSGKSVCINTIIMSILYRSTPDEVRLILIDPKVVELSVYNGVPHLLVPVVTDPKKAASALNWAVLEMTERYQKFAERSVRDIRGYNNNLKGDEKPLPQIVVIIDELADLMMVAPGEVEESICRLAQLARAAGIHLVIATQRPSVNVITGVIKANIPSRIAFTVASQVDSRTILDSAGAEKLLGRGDMLFFPQGVGKPQRVQGANVTDEEINAVTEFIKSQHEAVYNPDILEQMENAEQSDAEKEEKKDDDCDPLLAQAIEIAVELGQVSISMLQRRMRIGYARAGRIVDEMTQRGIVGAADGAKPRMVLISREEFKRLYGDQSGN